MKGKKDSDHFFKQLKQSLLEVVHQEILKA